MPVQYQETGRVELREGRRLVVPLTARSIEVFEDEGFASFDDVIITITIERHKNNEALVSEENP